MRRKHCGRFVASAALLAAAMFVMTSSVALATPAQPPTEDFLSGPWTEDSEETEDPVMLGPTTDVTQPPTDSATTSPTTTTEPSFLNFDPSKNTGGLTTIKRITFLQGGNDPLSITINIVNTALGFLGIISTILLAYAGWLWFTARGNDEQLEKAKNLIKGSLIGLVLTMTALGIAIFLFSILKTETTSPAGMEAVVGGND